MAVKVGGTTVIDDSRNLVNIGGLKTIAGSAILGSGDISFTTGVTVGSAQYTAYTSYVSYITALAQSIPEAPSDAAISDLEFEISGSTYRVRTKYRSLS